MLQVRSAAGAAVEETKKAGAAAVDAANTAAGNVADAVKHAAQDDTRSPVVHKVRVFTLFLYHLFCLARGKGSITDPGTITDRVPDHLTCLGCELPGQGSGHTMTMSPAPSPAPLPTR